MGFFFTIGAFVIVFSILVLAHEFGHFIAAKRSGIKVEEFGFGLPPRLWGKRKGETLYSINAIPFGGFVRMLGEEATVKGKLNKRSYSAQSKRTQVKVLVAGVFMNFLLAWVLISFGFMVGMQPLIASDDIFVAVDNGTVSLDEGAVIKLISSGSVAEKFGFKTGDKLIAFNDEPINSDAKALNALEAPGGVYKVLRDGTSVEIEARWEATVTGGSGSDSDAFGVFGVLYHDFISFPRVRIYEVAQDSLAFKSGLRDSDTLIAINGKGIYSLNDYDAAIENLTGSASYVVSRNGQRAEMIVESASSKKVIVSNVVQDRPAFSVGLKEGDIVVSVNDTQINSAQQMIEYVASNSGKTLMFLIDRRGESIYYEIKPEDGKIGVYLSELSVSSGPKDVTVYSVDQFSSVLNIKNEQYPIYSAPWYGLTETWRLTKLTGSLFGDLVSQIASTGEVPETVTGPVGIAQLSGTFASQGIIPFIRFIALLSISLAVLNILPFPALDGGKLLFIVIEFVSGRKIPQKWENLVHLLGYLVIIGLVLMITYKDVLRLFGID